MPSPRTVIQDIWLEPGTVISDREWTRTTFRQCHTRRSADLALRPRRGRLTYDRVTFTGDCGSTSVEPSLLIGGGLSDIYRAAVLEHDRTSPHYSIDISRARGHFEVRGYRASRMILNPELHAIVRLEDVIGRDITWLRDSRTTFDIPIGRLVERGYEDALLCAYPTSKYFDAQLAAIARLRADGIADTEEPRKLA